MGPYRDSRGLWRYGAHPSRCRVRTERRTCACALVRVQPKAVTKLTTPLATFVTYATTWGWIEYSLSTSAIPNRDMGDKSEGAQGHPRKLGVLAARSLQRRARWRRIDVRLALVADHLRGRYRSPEAGLVRLRALQRVLRDVLRGRRHDLRHLHLLLELLHRHELVLPPVQHQRHAVPEGR